MTGLAVAAALASAFCFALSTAMHQRAAKQQPHGRALDPRLLFRLLRSRLWQLGWIPDLTGSLLQAVALRYGPLTVVQPLLATGLFMAILIEAAWSRQRVYRRDLAGTLIGGVGLAVFLLSADPRAGVADPTLTAWWWVGAGIAGALAACLLASRPAGGATRGALLGVASGILYGLSAALIKPIAASFHGDVIALVVDPHLWALVLVGALALQLNQRAFQSGRLAAPLTALTLAEPVTGVVIGATAFRESLALAGFRLPLVVAAAAAIAVGVWLAGSSPRAGAR